MIRRSPPTRGSVTTPYARGSDTSKAAAKSMESSAASLRMEIFSYIEAQGRKGATDNEIELALDMRHQTASARRRELVQSGHIVDSEEQRHTDSGRLAIVWVMVPEDERTGPLDESLGKLQRALKARIDLMDTAECEKARELLAEFFEVDGGSLDLFA